MHRILSVGQCGFDHATIVRQVGRGVGADVLAARTFPEALTALRGGHFDLVLVNRVSDADGSSGFDLIEAIKADAALGPIPVMLVSNFADAQTRAQALGALPGFGKDDLMTGAALDRLRRAFSEDTAPSPTP